MLCQLRIVSKTHWNTHIFVFFFLVCFAVILWILQEAFEICFLSKMTAHYLNRHVCRNAVYLLWREYDVALIRYPWINRILLPVVICSFEKWYYISCKWHSFMTIIINIVIIINILIWSSFAPICLLHASLLVTYTHIKCLPIIHLYTSLITTQHSCPCLKILN